MREGGGERHRARGRGATEGALFFSCKIIQSPSRMLSNLHMYILYTSLLWAFVDFLPSDGVKVDCLGKNNVFCCVAVRWFI